MPLSAFRIPVNGLVTIVAFSLIVGTLQKASSSIVHASAKVDRAAGQALFHEKGCEHCHGVDGVGGEKGPTLYGVGRKLKPAQIRTQILNGGDAMPAFADVLAPDDVSLLVEYLSAKKKVIRVKGSVVPAGKPASQPNTGGSDDQ